ncbi:hypothetical protein FOA52_005888 [Chlamydomonas sp. UWO 241]|nr:hypothetical protein FOA52_005888 [Chlamydomonas sp. UWO 241]
MCMDAHAAPLLEGLTENVKVYDGAGIVPKMMQTEMEGQLSKLETETGWRVRVLTYKDPSAAPSQQQLREVWGPDKRTVVVIVDPSSPNILDFSYIGDDAAMKLRRPFWNELQGRFGNMFYVREEGEQAAVVNSVDALVGCLAKPEGCRVVPGIPADQYNFTLLTSICGGIIFGSAARLEPQGFVKRRWVWTLLFSPLWATLFVSYGLGPIVSRTSDTTPVLQNTAAFVSAAVAPTGLSMLLRTAPPRKTED